MGDGVTTIFVIPHGCGGTEPPYSVQATAGSLDAISAVPIGDPPVVNFYVVADTTNIKIIYPAAPPAGGPGVNNLSWNWSADAK